MAFHVLDFFFNSNFLLSVFTSRINMSASLGRPPVELNPVPQDGLAEPLLADPLTEQPVAGFSGIFKTQIPKESLNF